MEKVIELLNRMQAVVTEIQRNRKIKENEK